MDRVLLNPWVSRAGNATFLLGVLVFVVRLVRGAEPVFVLTVVLLAAGVTLMLTPYVARWGIGRRADMAKRDPPYQGLPVAGIQKSTAAIQRQHHNTAKHYLADVERRRAEPVSPADPTPHPDLLVVSELRIECEALEAQLWREQKAINRSGMFPIFPKAYIDRILVWNRKVLALADAHLSDKESSEVQALNGLKLFMPTAKQIEDLLASNWSALLKVERRLAG